MMKIPQIIAKIDGVFDNLTIPRTTNTDGALEAAVSFFFVLAGIIAVIMVIIGGWWYVLSSGDPQKTTKARNTILYAVIGLVISISAWLIIGFVLDRT